MSCTGTAGTQWRTAQPLRLAAGSCRTDSKDGAALQRPFKASWPSMRSRQGQTHTGPHPKTTKGWRAGRRWIGSILLGTADIDIGCAAGHIGLQFSLAANFGHAQLRCHSVVGTDRRCRTSGNIMAHGIRLGAGQQVVFCSRIGGDSTPKTDPGNSRLKSAAELLEDADLEW